MISSNTKWLSQYWSDLINGEINGSVNTEMVKYKNWNGLINGGIV